MDNYEYVNKSNISNDFICEICKNPFIDPVALPEPCEQTFCFKCIQLNLENHSQNCLQCNKKSLSNADLKKESLIVRKTLDNLPVKCRSCFQENIRRAKFSQHMQEIYNKITDKAIQYLSQIIQFKNQVIEEISLYSNKSITDGSVDDIFNMIRHNQSLKTFWIRDCQLSEQGKDKLQQSIQDKNNFDLLV
ncbi:unnamed protein product [Rotaria socialis]|uniref:RING-type domain-containing protein n=1 Tax=Rotaria socialis TaxID=392032 RepID=A0A818C205_9BILA|nr:unnamed protein product [Rotaria socialis]